MPRHRSRGLLLALAGLVSIAAAACGGDGPGGRSTTDTSAVPGHSRGAGAPGGAADSPVGGAVTVFAAASLTEAFSEVAAGFESRHPGTEVRFNFAASSALVQQIDRGAPADVFASADPAAMEKLTDAGAHAGPPRVFATNHLAIVVPPGNPEGIAGLADLARPGLVVVTGAPEVPIGRYSAEALARAGVRARPASYEADVKAVVSKVTTGEADAGIVYATDVRAAGSAASGVPIAPQHNVAATYPIVATRAAGNPGAAAAFVDYVTSEAGGRTLERFGFTAP